MPDPSFTMEASPWTECVKGNEASRQSSDASSRELCVLHLEDNPQDAELVRCSLEEEGFISKIVVAQSKEEFERAIEEGTFDLILSDYNLPSYNGLTALCLARDKQPHAPFILVSGSLGEEQAVDSLKSGATDYVLKTRLMRLAPAVRRALSEAEAQKKLEKAHKQLLEISRQAGMAEVATSVLHNVGNVLNSVNVASACLVDSLRKSKVTNLAKIATMLREHEEDLGSFLTSDPKGKQLPGYLRQLAVHLAAEQTAALQQLAELQQNIEHIKNIVMMQQSFAKRSGLVEKLHVTDLVKEALRMNSGSFIRHDIRIVEEFERVPPLTTEKHKVLQILINLMRNATQACDASERADKQLTIRISNGNDSVRISVRDNGVGIAPENLTRIFGHGFTTKKDGHGYGLHSGALAAAELRGSISVQSDGAGKGAVFTLELPLEF